MQRASVNKTRVHFDAPAWDSQASFFDTSYQNILGFSVKNTLPKIQTFILQATWMW